MRKYLRSFDGVKISYNISRISDKFVVFLHGAGGNLTAWKKEQVFFKKKNVYTVAIDLRGHGNSSDPDKPSDYSLDNFAKDVYSVIKKEKISDFILIGHCFGGMVSIMFHKLYPKMSKAYILIDTTYKSPLSLSRIFRKHPFLENLINNILDRRSLSKFSSASQYKYAGTSDFNLRRIYSDITSTGIKSWIFTYENISKFNSIDLLKKMNVPVLIIEGEKDSVFDVSVAKKIKNLIRGSKLSIIPGENHIIVLSNPKVLEKEIYSFIKAIHFI